MKILIVSIFLFPFSLSLSYAQINLSIRTLAELDVTDRLNVVLVPSEENYVTIEGELSDKVEVIQQDDRLRIKMTSGYMLKGANTYVKVYSPSVYRFIVQKGAIIQVEDGTIETDSLWIFANEGGKFDAAVQAKHVEIHGTTGATVELRGEAESQDVNLTFGGIYYGEPLATRQAIARINGGGVCELRAAVSVDVQTRAGGVIDVYGNPSERKQRRLAGGKITFKEIN